MTHVLQDLRKEWQEASTAVEALGRAAAARTDEARQVERELETAALAGDSAKCAEYMESLAVIEARWAELLREKGRQAERAKEASAAIRGFYEVAADGGPKVDWVPVLVTSTRALYSGWGSSWSSGQFLAIDKELTDPELAAIQWIIVMCKGWNNTSCRVSFVLWDERLRLRAMYPAYRGDCWTDFDGNTLLGMIRPIFERNALGAKVAEFCSGLGVLK